MKKWIRKVLTILAVIILLLGTLGFVFYERFVVSAPEHEFLQASSLKEAQEQDLTYLARYPQYDRSLDSNDKKRKFALRLDSLRNSLPLSIAEFEMEIARAMAIADNAHSNISFSARAKRLNSIPLRFYWFKEGLYVILAQKEYDYLLGQRVLKINNISPTEMLSKMKPCFGGTTEYLKAQSPLLFISPEVLSAMKLGDNAEAVEIETENKHGDITMSTVGLANGEQNIGGFWPSYWLIPSEKIKESSWRSIAGEVEIALPFRNIRKNVHYSISYNRLYVQINENDHDAGRNLKEYLEKVAEESKAKQIDYIILDLRFNQGGNDYHLPWPFIRSLDRLTNSNRKCYIITGNYTFSAGIITTAYAKYILDEKAIVIGEKIGDRLTFWADGGQPMTLPNSKISPRIWTAYNDWENGCHDLMKCFWISVFDSFGVGDLTPQHQVRLSFKDYIKGEDTLLNFIDSTENKNNFFK